MFRPILTVWIEILSEQDSAPSIISLLAEAQVIELQEDTIENLPFKRITDEAIRNRLDGLEARYNRFKVFLPLPDPSGLSAQQRLAPTAHALAEIEKSLTTWSQSASSRIERIRHIAAELEKLALLDTCLAALPDSSIDMAVFSETVADNTAQIAPWLAWSDAFDPNLEEGLPDNTFFETFRALDDNEKNAVLLGSCERARLPELEQRLHGRGVRFARVPSRIKGAPSTARAQIRATMDKLDEERHRLQQSVEKVNRDMAMAGVIWLLQRQRWFVDTLDHVARSERFIWITGWVPKNKVDELRRQLEQSDAPFLLGTDTGAGRGTVPVVLDNPSWMRGFEWFVRTFGTPASHEVDPTPLLAFVMPLMFGYMFGDVGQGIILVLAGWLLRHRYPVLGLLIPAGWAAIAFGFLFGSVFFVEQWIPALWLHPLDEPFYILTLPLVFGGILLLLSMFFGGLVAHWRDERAPWWIADFPVMVAYTAIPLFFWSVETASFIVMLALLWRIFAFIMYRLYVYGTVAIVMETVKNLSELLEVVMQLATNTLSFARIGAFALAHAGLGGACIALTMTTDNPLLRALIFILGNILAIVLEGLVVSIQTSRLIMFEFFRRFLRAEGRTFKPLAPPLA